MKRVHLCSTNTDYVHINYTTSINLSATCALITFIDYKHRFTCTINQLSSVQASEQHYVQKRPHTLKARLTPRHADR